MEDIRETSNQAAEVKRKTAKGKVKDIDYSKLREDAARQLNDRLQKGDLSAADLMKVMAFCPPQKEETLLKNGNWVLVLQEDK
ncbi:MAG: hypothetical protein GX781_08830 [Clostridiales bacterium]|nr:hypothetical protein [Clostridiales bacterium]